MHPQGVHFLCPQFSVNERRFVFDSLTLKFTYLDFIRLSKRLRRGEEGRAAALGRGEAAA
jgi:hypothetical protein